MLRLPAASLMALATFSATALAEPALAQPDRAPIKLDPNVTRAIETGLVGGGHRGPGITGRAKVLIELAAPATEESLAQLHAAGAELKQVQGKTLFYRRFVPARVTAESVAKVAALPAVVHISHASGRGPMPLDRSAEIVRLADARGARPDLDFLTGTGVVIGDVDSLVDPFQPAFFKGDAGYFDWIDTDGDGVLTPGVDSIDLNQNGVADAGEIAVWLPVTPIDYLGPVKARTISAFDPGIDWLYIDVNGDGKRNYGDAAGFDDTAPALGEPLFVPDDVNLNGKVDVGERLVRLGTSKFRKIQVTLTTPDTDDLFVRGSNLSKAKVDYSGGTLYGYADAEHATGVNTILIGDVPLVGRRWVGMAPDAEVVLAWDDTDETGLPIDGATFVLGETPNVMLYELAPWTGQALDGTDPLSQLIDESETSANVTHTCPTGDQGSAHKHAHAQVLAAQVATLQFDLPASAKSASTPLSYIDLSINVRGGTPADFTLTGPNGDAHDLSVIPNGKFPSGTQFYSTVQTTTRGTWFADVILYGTTATNHPAVGTWTLTVHGDPHKVITVDAYVSDDQSSWGLGAAWMGAASTDVSTIGIPSVADHCIAVNAQPDHLEAASEPWYSTYYDQSYDVPEGYADTEGKIRAYTPLGPRIDGVIKPDVTAPDNPWVASEHLTTEKTPYGSYRVFGGTSGASPHVTGVAALLAQAGIQGDKARDAIRAGAVSDTTTGTVPNGSYGYGRLDAAAALGITTVGKPFTVTLTTKPLHPTIADKVTLVATAQADDGDATSGIATKWDDGYDGTWDTTYDTVLTHQVSSNTIGAQPYKVRARNAGGRVAEAVLWIDYAKAPPPGCSCRMGAGSADPSDAGTLALLLGALGILGGWQFVRRMRARRT